MERYNSFTHSETNGESDFPGGLVVKTPCSQCRGPGCNTGQGTRSYVFATKNLHTATKDPACHN